MKKIVDNKVLTLQPVPQTIVSCRDAQGKDNALVVGFAANVSLNPPMIMVGIMPSRYSHHMVKETGCFVVNLPAKDQKEAYDYLGSHSGANEDKLAKLGLKTENGTAVNAPILSNCPVSIECSVVESIKPGTHELFIGLVEAVHCDEQYLDEQGNIQWDRINLL
ncbi:MAG: flavin reductase family protein [Eubacteriales bacterium]|nr:flavin reductase family protein [Eubacteriales bacterium]